MNKQPPKSGKRPIPADNRKDPRGQRNNARPNGAPAPGNMRNTANTARKNAPPQQKRPAPKTPPKNAPKTPPKSAPKAPQKKAPSGQPRKNRPMPPVKKGSADLRKDPRAARPQSTVRKRHKYHGGNYILYYMLAGVVVITILVILANTVLFRCKDIVVTGNARYSAEQIAECSGIVVGKNLLHIKTHQAEENIVAALAYIDSAEVSKSFPNGINITVTEAEKRFCVKQGNITAAVSYAGKIVEQCAPNGLTVVTGYDPVSVEVGSRLRSKTEGKTDIPAVILDAVGKAALQKVDEVDLTDRFSIKMYIDSGRVTLELGTASDMESKLKVANELISNHLSSTERVTILLTNPTMATVDRNDVPEPGTSSDVPTDPDNSDAPSDPDNSDNSGDSGDSSDPQT